MPRLRLMRVWAVACLAIVALTDHASAQTIARRVQQVKNGTVRMSFASRPDVCGNGRNNISTRGDNQYGRRRDEWMDECEPGPVRVALDISDGYVIALRTYVGGRWRAPGDATDLGMVGARDAVDFLLDVVAKDASKAAGDAIFPATLADSVVAWPRLLRLARDETRSQKVRTQAVFWVGQAAGEKAAEGLKEVVDDSKGDREVRKSAVFALSQQHANGVPMLINVAQTSKDPEIRKQAIFWLGQSKDDRALAFFEAILKR